MTSPTRESKTVSNTSCLIALESIGQLDLLERLYRKVLIPTAVVAEWGSPYPPWMTVQVVQNQSLVQALRMHLGPGEAEAIALSIEVAADRIILDDQRARRVAGQFNLSITGTVGIVLRATHEGVVPLARPILDDLHKAGLWLSDELLQRSLRLAGE